MSVRELESVSDSKLDENLLNSAERGDDDEQNTQRSTGQHAINADCFRRLRLLLRMGWSWSLTFRAILCFLIVIVITLLNIYGSEMAGAFVNAILDGDADSILDMCKEVSLIICGVIAALLLQSYLAEHMALEWRRGIVERFHELVFVEGSDSKLLYALNQLDSRVDNFDERVSESTRLLTTGAIGIAFGSLTGGDPNLLTAAFTIVANSIYLVYSGFLITLPGALIFSGLCLFAVIKAMGPVAILQFKQNSLEATFRLQLAQLRISSETVAFYKAEAREYVTSTAIFNNVAANYSLLVNRIFRKDIVTFIVSYTANTVPYFLVCINVMIDKSSHDGGEITTLIGVLSGLMAAFQSFFFSFSALAPVAGDCHRVGELAEVLEDLTEKLERQHSSQFARFHEDSDERKRSRSDASRGAVVLSRVTVAVPLLTESDDIERTASQVVELEADDVGSDDEDLDEQDRASMTTTSAKRILVENLNLRVNIGEHLLIVGPAGTGKSSVLRTVAGLWPIHEGLIDVPPSAFFVPQKPYLTKGSLLANVAYPDNPITQPMLDDEADEYDVSALLCSESSITEIMELVGLAFLVEQWGLHKTVDWEQVLSGGEQQRLGIARLLYHRPEFAFLDESTSALDVTTERRVMNAINLFGITMISVGHRETLVEYHHNRLALHREDNGYTFTKIDHGNEAAMEGNFEDLSDQKGELAPAIPLNEERLLTDIKDEIELNREYQQEQENLLPITVHKPQSSDSSDNYKKTDMSAEVNDRHGVNLLFLSRFARLWNMHFGYTGKCELFALAIIMFIGIAILVSSGVLTGLITEFLTNGDITSALEYTGLGVATCFAASWLVSLAQYKANKLMLAWREDINARLQELAFVPRAFYNVNNLDKSIANLDLRLSGDVKNLTELCYEMIFLQSGLLPSLIQTPLVCAAVAYYSWWCLCIYLLFVLTSFLIIPFTLGLVSRRTFVRETWEGRYRYILIRTRTFAEQITFYRGEGKEYADLVSTFKQLYNRVSSWISAAVVMSGVLQFYVYFGANFGIMVIGFRTVLKGGAFLEINEVVTLMTMMGLLSASTTGFLIRAGKLGDIAGYVHRIAETIDILEAVGAKLKAENASSSAIIYSEQADKLILDKVTVATPDLSRVLYRDMTMNIESGQHLIIMGPSGCGKSSLLRIMSGLWPLRKGGSLQLPMGLQVMFVPQQAYTPRGSLLDQIIYPLTRDQVVQDEASMQESVKEVLEFVHLGDLLKEWGLDRTPTVVWSSMLSGGQQQSLNFARLFFHRPMYAVMDEATSAMDPPLQAKVLSRCQEMNITMISVAHRPSAMKFHTHLLTLKPHRKNGVGTWNLSEL